jgi:release factor glutamine methyltransferase
MVRGTLNGTPMNPTVAAALAEARSLGLARLDAQLLLAHVLGRTRSWVIANDREALDAPAWQRWSTLVRRRAAGEPLAYLTGEREFHGLSLQVTPQVLVPRPDTEVLVEWALELIDAHVAATGRAAPRVIDLGTGSGAIALAVKHARPACDVTAVDLSPGALEVARANGRRLALPVRWLHSDWFAAVAGERFDLVLANAPYIAESDPHLADLHHEPLSALASGPQGLDAITHLVAAARDHLSPQAWLLLEHGHNQAAPVRDLLHAANYRDIAMRHDLAGQPRCTGARKTAH